MLLHGSLDALLFSEGGSLSLTLWLGRSDPSLDSDRLSLGRFDPEVDGSLSDGGWLPLPDDPRLGPSLWLGRSLPDVDAESLVDRDTDVLCELDWLPEADNESLVDPDCDRLCEVESDPMIEPDSLVEGRE